MLQRAASNAYSWWWASHIRTKQSKWLEQNLQDMEEKVQGVLKLIQEDGDSFAKRAEMYYKKRPELITFVEESYRAYRALADRYDHMSTELQNANNTIAYVFPEQVQFAMEEEEEEEPSPKFQKKPPEGSKANVPKVPQIPKELIGFTSSATKKFQSKKPTKIAAGPNATKSGLSKSEGLQEIDKLQKQILALQTEKEFVKSSYENGLAKYWEIDQEIREMQDKVCSLQDDFGAGIVIEDDEARNLMASVALKSCEDTLAQLQEKQERSTEEAAVESRRIEYAREKLKSLKDEFVHCKTKEENSQANNEPRKEVEELKSSGLVVNSGNPERQDLEMPSEKIKEHFDVGSALTVNELAEKIDELVNKVISFEATVSSQTALIQRLRSETDELQAQILTLEDDKLTLIDSKKELQEQILTLEDDKSALIDGKKDLSDKLRRMEDKLHALQNVNQSVEMHNSNLQKHFPEAHANLDQPLEKLHSVRPEEEAQITQLLEGGSLAIAEPKVELKGQEGATTPHYRLGELLDVKPEAEAQVMPLTEVGPAAELESQVKSTGQEGATKPDISLEQLLDKKPENEHKVSGESHEELKGQEDAPKPNGSVGELLNMKQEKETNVSDFQLRVDKSPEEANVSDIQQRVDESPAEVGMLAEVKEKEEKPDQSVRNENHPSTSKNIEKENTCQDTKNDISNGSPETLQNLKKKGEPENEASSMTMDNAPIVEIKGQETKEEDEPDWKQMFMNGMENREKVLLTEYTSLLRNFKEAKKKLSEAENKGEKSLFDVTLRLRELKSANAKKDAEIRILHQKLKLFQASLDRENESEKSTVTDKDASVELQELLMVQPEKTSEIEEKFRANIDVVLEENLEFWLRFSSSFQEIQKFEVQVKDLQSESSKLEEKLKNQDGSSTPKHSLKSDAKPLYKHLREIHTELTVWIEKGTVLKDELKSRFSSLCDIQEEITAALKDSAEEGDFRFTSFQGAKFQGEILNMKQENKKVADELQAGLDHVTTLQLEVERSLAKLNEKFKLSGSTNHPNIQLQHSESRSRVPLRSFIFGVKPKKQKTSIFSCMHPALQKKCHGFRSTPKAD